ncbi:MAG: PQQ-binding-like beta-propeller repeat protein [Limnochordaceae bacterium]|nr:PQQ-binding-like beta-propeller repeat protein [Limnochordaceae bacterium]
MQVQRKKVGWWGACFVAIILVVAAGRFWLANGERTGAPAASTPGAVAPGAQPQEFVFALISDTHIQAGEDSNRTVHAILQAVAERVKVDPPDKAPAFLLDLGDVTNTGDETEFDQLQAMLPPVLSSRFRAVPGNHEVRWSRWGKQLFEQRLGSVPFSFDYGGVHFVGLDSTQVLQEAGYFDDQELAWLQADLDRVGQETPIILFFHHPIGANNYYVGNQDALLRLLEPYNIRAAFVGHIHRESVWVQNGIPFISLPSARDQAAYYRIQVQLETSPRPPTPQAPAVVPVQLRVERVSTGRTLWGGTSVVATLPLAGERPGRAARPLAVAIRAAGMPSGAGTAAVATTAAVQPPAASALQVWLPARAPVAEVQYQVDWPAYGVSHAGRWQALQLQPVAARDEADQAQQGRALWQVLIDPQTVTPGLHHVQVRVKLRTGELWDSFIPLQVQPAVAVAAAQDVITVLATTPGVSTSLPSSDGTAAAVPAQAPPAASNSSMQPLWRWRQPLGAPVQAGLLVIPDRPQQPARVIVATTRGQVLALSARTGERLWESTINGPVTGTPAVNSDGTRLYVSSGGGWVYALSSENGQPQWAYRAPEPALGSPLWVAARTSTVAGKPSWPELVIIPSGKTLVALVAATGESLWQRTLTGWVGGRPAVDVQTGGLFVGAGDGAAYAFDLATGQPRWRTPVGYGLLHGPWASQLAIVPARESGSRSLVLVGTVDDMEALDSVTGQKIWTLGGGFLYSAPVLVPTGGGARPGANPKEQGQATESDSAHFQDFLERLVRDVFGQPAGPAAPPAVPEPKAEPKPSDFSREGASGEDGSPGPENGTATQVVLVDEKGSLVTVEPASGRVLQRVELGEAVLNATPVWGGPEQPERIYVQGVLGSIFAIDWRRAASVASWRVSTGAYVFATPALWEGLLFTAGLDGWVQALPVSTQGIPAAL